MAPVRWFNNPLTKGPFAGERLSSENYDKLLSWYYELREWDKNGIPEKTTLEQLGLSYVVEELNKIVKLKP